MLQQKGQFSDLTFTRDRENPVSPSEKFGAYLASYRLRRQGGSTTEYREYSEEAQRRRRRRESA